MYFYQLQENETILDKICSFQTVSLQKKQNAKKVVHQMQNMKCIFKSKTLQLIREYPNS